METKDAVEVEHIRKMGRITSEVVSKVADLLQRSPVRSDEVLLIRGKGRRERLAFFVEPTSFERITTYVTTRTTTPAALRLSSASSSQSSGFQGFRQGYSPRL